ncbi:peptidoglycan DD-metalloendopeptidase family protein [Microbacteriaceae bacterium]|nr:peptidoglycan DD-metalloendopeptidase family protein [Candidatus Saccharibacteria bacterium]
MKRVAAALVAGLLVIVGGLGFLVFAGGSYDAQESACKPTSTLYDPVVTGSGSTSTFKEPEQVKNAQTIIGVGLARKLSLRDIKIALMVAMQEAQLRNVAYGDRDSAGLFQQRTSQGWGTVKQIITPVYSSNKFYEALEKIKSRDSKSLFEVAVAVQRPDRAAYAKTFGLWDAPATAFLKGVSSVSTTLPIDVASPQEGCTSLLGDVEVAVQAALSQNGKPYRWAVPSTKQFDSAELMQWAYAQAGVTLPVTAAAQLKAGPPVSKPGSGSMIEWKAVLKRGDLLYWTDSTGKNSHVSMYLGMDEMIDAPISGANVSISKVPWTNLLVKLVGATRPTDNNGGGGLHSGWQWPLKSTTITSPYGMRFHPVKHVWRLHDGVDFAASTGTPVYAARSGVVSFVGPLGEAGNAVIINHDGGVITSYFHLSSFANTRVGDAVKAGQQIALSGNTGGSSTGPHLHFKMEVRGQSTNPIVYLKQFGLVP